MKIILGLVLSLILASCASHPGENLPNSQEFLYHSVEEIQSELISAYLSSEYNYSIKEQTKNSITFTRVNDAMSGIVMAAAMSGNQGALPIIEVQFAFAPTHSSIRVFTKVRIVNTNGFGRQEINYVKNPAGAKESLHYIRQKMEPS